MRALAPGDAGSVDRSVGLFARCQRQRDQVLAVDAFLCHRLKNTGENACLEKVIHRGFGFSLAVPFGTPPSTLTVRQEHSHEHDTEVHPQSQRGDNGYPPSPWHNVSPSKIVPDTGSQDHLRARRKAGAVPTGFLRETGSEDAGWKARQCPEQTIHVRQHCAIKRGRTRGFCLPRNRFGSFAYRRGLEQADRWGAVSPSPGKQCPFCHTFLVLLPQPCVDSRSGSSLQHVPRALDSYEIPDLTSANQ
jgi:hypothetical protein